MIAGATVAFTTRILRTVAALLLLAMPQSGWTDDDRPESMSRSTYAYPNRIGYGFEFDRNHLRLKWLGKNPEPDAGNWTLLDCSTPEFDCVSAYQWVFAVPKARHLRVDQEYQVASTRFKNLGCMQRIEQHCEVFVIRATPLNVKTSDAATSAIARDPRREAIFILDVKRGVIAFEESTDWPKQVDVSTWDLNSIGRTAAMYTLIGKSGVLAKPGIKNPEQPDRDIRGCAR